MMYLAQCIENIVISMCNPHKKCWGIHISIFILNFENPVCALDLQAAGEEKSFSSALLAWATEACNQTDNWQSNRRKVYKFYLMATF